MISVASRLSSASGDKTQTANKRLAVELAESGDSDAVVELVRLAESGPKAQTTDAIKVIGELSTLSPDLLLAHVPALVEIARTGKGVHLWESLTTLASIAEFSPETMGAQWRVFEVGLGSDSVIARDNSVRGLCALASGEQYQPVIDALLVMMESCPVNQFPTYAERIAAVLQADDKPRLADVLERRIGEMPNPAKSRRVIAVLKRIS